MKSGLLLATLVALAGTSQVSGPADATWAAMGKLEDGTSPYCAGGSVPMPEWAGAVDGQVDIRGNTLTFTSTSRVPNRSFAVDLKVLRPDGSGRVAGRDDKNREFYVTLDPGSGARPFRLTYAYNACRRIYTPKV
jgi:hypothetical protein